MKVDQAFIEVTHGSTNVAGLPAEGDSASGVGVRDQLCGLRALPACEVHILYALHGGDVGDRADRRGLCSVFKSVTEGGFMQESLTS